MKRLVTAAGLLSAQPLYYWAKTFIALATVAACVAVTLLFDQPLVRIGGALALGFATTQIALLAHDVGHRQAFRSRRANLAASWFFGSLLLCVSFSWWTTKHNKHHATPNHLDDDPDIQFPMIVFDSEQISAKARILRPFIARQAYLFVFLLPFQGIAMRATSVGYLFKPRVRLPWLQALGMALHVALYAVFLVLLGGWPIALAFVVIHQATFGLYNSSVFASNHKGMEIIRAGGRMDFLREQVVTSRNINGFVLTDFWYGGLNYQIEHHLFPTMPRNRLAEAQKLVRPFCEQHGISYHSTTLVRSYRETFAHLDGVSASLRGA